MREIKFRVWGVFNPHFGEPVYEMRDDVFVNDGEAYHYTQPFGASIYTPCELQKVGDAKIMQHTGLKDKNGVEIYEGDIIVESFEWDLEEEIPYEIKFGPFGYSSTVGFHAFDMSGEKYDFYGGMPDDDLRVIGNIYENPELLEGKNDTK